MIASGRASLASGFDLQNAIVRDPPCVDIRALLQLNNNYTAQELCCPERNLKCDVENSLHSIFAFTCVT